MKTFKIFLAGFALSAAIIASYAFVQESKPKVYDYVTILDIGTNAQYISYSDGKFEKIPIDAKGFEYNEDLKLINKLEKDGYELTNNNFSMYGGLPITGHNYFLLRKEHKE